MLSSSSVPRRARTTGNYWSPYKEVEVAKTYKTLMMRLKNKASTNIVKLHRHEYNQELARLLKSIPDEVYEEEIRRRRKISGRISWEVVVKSVKDNVETTKRSSWTNRSGARAAALKMLQELGTGEARIFRRKGDYRDERAGFVVTAEGIVSNYRGHRRSSGERKEPLV